MANLSDIKYRMKGVSDTRQITKAMETVSISKMRKALQLLKTNESFFAKIIETIHDIVLHTGNIDNRYMQKRKNGYTLFVVIAADKGLCGAYNHNVLNLALNTIKDIDKDKLSIFAVGHMATAFFEKRDMIVDMEFVNPSQSNKDGQRFAAKIAQNIIVSYDEGLVDSAYVVYTHVNNSGEHSPQILPLLPLVKEQFVKKGEKLDIATEDYFKELEYEPSHSKVLDSLIKQYLTGVIFGAIVQSSAAEHSSRRVAMSNSTNNASDILDRLNLEYNRARQASVTNEILEIVAASAAVQD